MSKKIINVVYKVDDKELRDTKTTIQGVEKETKDAEKEMLKLDKAVKQTGNDGKKSFGEFGTVLKAIGWAALGAQVFSLGKKIFELGVKQEQVNIAFTTFLGSATKAKKLLAELNNYAIITPFTVDQINGAAKALLAFGVRGNEIMPILKMLGDVSSGTGKDLTELAIIFGQIKSTGRLMGQDLLQLINAGFNPLQVISEQTGKSMRTLKEDMEKGAISFQMVSEAFKSATSEGGLFYEMTIKQGQSIGGLMSTIGGNIDEGLKNIYTATSGPIKEFIDQLVKLSEAWIDFTETKEQIFDKEAQKNIEVYTKELDKAIELIEKKAPGAVDTFNKALGETIKEANLWRESVAMIEKALESSANMEEAGFWKKEDGIKAYFEKRNQLITQLEVEKATVALLSAVTKEYIKDANKAVNATAQVVEKAKDIKKGLTYDDIFTQELLKNNEKFLKEQEELEKKGAETQKKIDEDYAESYEFKLQERLDADEAYRDQTIQAMEDNAEKQKAIDKAIEDNKEAARQRSIQLGIQAGAMALEALFTQNEIETGAIQEKYEKQMELTGNNERAKADVEKRREKELANVERKNKEIQKKNALVRIGIDTAVAIGKTFAQFGWPAGIVPAALMAGIGAIQAAAVRKFKKGEVNIKGPGTGTSDSIPAMISKGESVINADATSRSKNLLHAINDRKLDDKVLMKISHGGKQSKDFDDSRIVAAINKKESDYMQQGYTLMKATEQGKNFKRIIRAKVQGY